MYFGYLVSPIRLNVLWVPGVAHLSEYLFSKTGNFVCISYGGVYIKIVNKIEFSFKFAALKLRSGVCHILTDWFIWQYCTQ